MATMTEDDPILEALTALRHRREEAMQEVQRIETAIASLELLVPVAAPPLFIPPPSEVEWPRPSAKSLMMRLMLEGDRDWSVPEVIQEYENRGITFQVKDPNNALRAAVAEENKKGTILRTAPGRYKAAKWTSAQDQLEDKEDASSD